MTPTWNRLGGCRLPARAVLAVVALATAPGFVPSTRLAGQEIRLRVRDGLGNPAVGAIVSLLASDSAAVAQGVVGHLGRVRLVAPAGRYRVLVQQPGFADTVVADVRLSEELADSIEVAATRRRPTLPSTVVALPDRCESPGVPAALEPAWREARKALAAVALTEERSLADLSIAAFVRRLSTGAKLEDESINTLLARANRPPNPGTVEGRAREGFLTRSADSLRWVTADVDFFLDPGFAADYCFGLTSGTENRAGLLGLTFAPRTTAGVRIQGTFWLDPAERRLRQVDYSFLGLPRDWRPERAGGSIEVHPMDPGFWVTRFWYQRTPAVQLATQGRGRDRLIGFREEGAEITGLVPRIDTTDRIAAAITIAQREAALQARVARMQGIVTDSLGQAIPDAEVAILGTDFATTTARDGRFRLGQLPLGLQMVRVRKIGYRPQYFAIRLVAGQEWEGRIGIAQEPRMLGEILVVGKYGKPPRYANTSKYDAFYRRRATGVGRFITREDIDKRGTGKIGDLLVGIPGVRVVFGRPGGTGEDLEFSTCPGDNVSIWIDGQRLSGAVTELLGLIRPLDVEAIEVYPRESSIPAEFRENTCAAIVMWTR